MKKEIKDPREKIYLSISATSGSDDGDGRSINTFKDKRSEELKLTRRQTTDMMDEIEAVVESYKGLGIPDCPVARNK